MNWTRALGECAHVMRELHEVREAGFTEAALAFPRSPLALRLIAAFNGGPANWTPPRGWHYFPNALSKAAWERVIAHAYCWEPFDRAGDALDLFHIWGGRGDWPNDATRKAWERVHVAALTFLKEAEAA